MPKPKIAVLMDENTSSGATRYEASKGYFQAIADAGGLPFGLPYLSGLIDVTIDEFDGLVTGGGRFAYPPDWYIGDAVSLAPASDRFEIEKAIVRGFLARDKPVLGICAGMQMLACLQGCKLTPDLNATFPDALEHDKVDQRHRVTVTAGSKLSTVVGVASFGVNSLHREAVAELTGNVVACARADDGIIEAIELPRHRYALGVQWHQEAFAGTEHAGNRLFAGLIGACKAQ